MRKVRRNKKRPLTLRILINIIRITLTPAMASIIIATLFITWFYLSGNYDKSINTINDTYHALATNTGTTLNGILLAGQQHTPKEDIISAITNNNTLHIGDPLLGINLWEIKQRIEQLTWVKHAIVERQYPSTLSVHINEREPMALWQTSNKVHLIDQDGKIINANNLDNFSHLLILVGKDAPAHSTELFQLINSEPELAQLVSSAIRISGRRWNIRLYNNLEIKLPEESPHKAWSYLANKHLSNNLLNSNIKSIDLRIKDKLFISQK